MTAMTSSAPTSRQASHNDNIRLFYDILVLMSTLSPSFGSQLVIKTDWHRSLDSLSWLCDFKCGGSTVTSIAVQQLARSSKFWISTNEHHTRQSSAHLELVLAGLARLRGASASSTERVREHILTQSIRLSRLRVNNYCRRLANYIDAVQASGSDSSDTGQSLNLPCIFDSLD